MDVRFLVHEQNYPLRNRMHPTAMSNGKLFFDTYVVPLKDAVVVEIGAQDVNGSLRQVSPPGAQYIGVDFVAGKGVDVVLTDPYRLPFENESADVVVSSSCLEHSEMFWLVFTEVLRVLKPHGLFYLNVPSNGAFHRYPVDCWRFFPDSGKALVTWARREGMNPALLESYTSHQRADIWNDFVAVFVKDETHVGRHPGRILNTFKEFENGYVYGNEKALNFAQMPEDFRRAATLTQQLKTIDEREAAIRAVLSNQQAVLEKARAEIHAANERADRCEALLARQASNGGAASSLLAHSPKPAASTGPLTGQQGSSQLQCGHCGGTHFATRRVLPPALVNAWQLSPAEAEYINRQQGEVCLSCNANLRSVALANAIRASLNSDALLKDVPALFSSKDLRILEINEAGTLSPTLREFSGYTFASYPEVDMHSMPYADASFDLVIHSDTLEHVANPVHALSECRRVLKHGGALCFTVPVVVDRLTRNRDGLAKSFHGNPAANAEDYLVQTEYGADAWTHVMRAGFTNVTIHSVGYPAATALVARRT
jgi:ubiquinone/menaquinone biosynthesis C-methylase UbiE